MLSRLDGPVGHCYKKCVLHTGRSSQLTPAMINESETNHTLSSKAWNSRTWQMCTKENDESRTEGCRHRSALGCFVKPIGKGSTCPDNLGQTS